MYGSQGENKKNRRNNLPKVPATLKDWSWGVILTSPNTPPNSPSSDIVKIEKHPLNPYPLMMWLSFPIKELCLLYITTKNVKITECAF